MLDKAKKSKIARGLVISLLNSHIKDWTPTPELGTAKRNPFLATESDPVCIMISCTTILAVVAFLPAAVLGTNNSASSFVSSLPLKSQGLFNESMEWMDDFYDSSAGYLYDVSAASTLRHETRSSAWYAVGLLARNNGTDVEEALKIIVNVISGQFQDPKDQW
jgi:hypothetical protein